MRYGQNLTTLLCCELYFFFIRKQEHRDLLSSCSILQIRFSHTRRPCWFEIWSRVHTFDLWRDTVPIYGNLHNYLKNNAVFLLVCLFTSRVLFISVTVSIRKMLPSPYSSFLSTLISSHIKQKSQYE